MRAALVEAGQPADLLPTVFARTLLTGFAAHRVGSLVPLPGRVRRRAGPDHRPGPRRPGTVADAFGELAPHADVEPALRRLVEAGVRVVTLTHGSPGVAEAGLERGGITPLVERIAVERVDPGLEARPRGLPVGGRGCDVAPERMALVAAHGWDVLGAQRAGLTGAWFPAASELSGRLRAAARAGPPGRRRRRAARAARA